MTAFSLFDVYTLESDLDTEPEQEALALQRAINGGLWSLQGSYGRAMMAAIEAGRCMLGPAPGRDYYGHRVPSRTEVEEGTMGSRGFVVEQMGEAWALMLEGA